ncbi:MAG: hypothetical protein R3245_08750 [Kiloniellales bacterium]|nr:hypothetical protein [Kiloniellales bacterium]
MSIASTSLNGTISAFFGVGRSATRPLALPSPSQLATPASRVERIQPDPPRQEVLDGRSQNRNRNQAVGPVGPEERHPQPALENRPTFAPTTLFVAQILGQSQEFGSHPGLNRRAEGLPNGRDAAARGVDLYRRAGAEPAILSDKPAFLSLAV